MKTLEQLTTELVTLGIPVEMASLAAAKQYAELLKAAEDAARATAEAADKAAGIDVFCGVRCSGISYIDSKTGQKIVNPTLRGAKALEDGIGLESAKTGTPGTDGKAPLYPPCLWLFRTGKSPIKLYQGDVAALAGAITAYGAEKVCGIIQQIGSPEAVANFAADKAAGIAAGLYQDTDNKRNRKA